MALISLMTNKETKRKNSLHVRYQHAIFIYLVIYFIIFYVFIYLFVRTNQVNFTYTIHGGQHPALWWELSYMEHLYQRSTKTIFPFTFGFTPKLRQKHRQIRTSLKDITNLFTAC